MNSEEFPRIQIDVSNHVPHTLDHHWQSKNCTEYPPLSFGLNGTAKFGFFYSEQKALWTKVRAQTCISRSCRLQVSNALHDGPFVCMTITCFTIDGLRWAPRGIVSSAPQTSRSTRSKLTLTEIGRSILDSLIKYIAFIQIHMFVSQQYFERRLSRHQL